MAQPAIEWDAGLLRTVQVDAFLVVFALATPAVLTDQRVATLSHLVLNGPPSACWPNEILALCLARLCDWHQLQLHLHVERLEAARMFRGLRPAAALPAVGCVPDPTSPPLQRPRLQRHSHGWAVLEPKFGFFQRFERFERFRLFEHFWAFLDVFGRFCTFLSVFRLQIRITEAY